MGKDIAIMQRLQSAVRGIASIILSSKILAILEAVVLDVYFKAASLKKVLPAGWGIFYFWVGNEG
ncbi:MAG: hypothetical protein P8185_15640 [Deltaproteobacteria bacterium]